MKENRNIEVENLQVSPPDAKPMLEALACEGSCDVHKGKVVPVIIEGHGWDGLKFKYCQAAIEEDERRGFIVRQYGN